MQTTFAAVLTGDIVKSRAIAAEDYDQLFYTLQQTLQKLTLQQQGKFDIYRGDAFQAIFAKPAAAIRGCLGAEAGAQNSNSGI